MTDTEKLIVQVAREVSEIHGAMPHMATKEYVEDAISEHAKKRIDPKLMAKFIAAGTGLVVALTALVWAIL